MNTRKPRPASVTHRVRLDAVIDWLADGATIEAATGQAAEMWYPTQRKRAEKLVASADKYLRGVRVIGPGAPRQYASFSAAMGEPGYITHPDGSRTSVAIMRGDGDSLTWSDDIGEHTLAPVDWFDEASRL